ncbi:unnamed protein product [Candida verbasci]|uniref:Knr4/Smi1-like domain-containing protein n=1 Tax=Candida verbasci TaxID=1227364 RepID=A0A9W4TWX0_9ASCO|nr:unnamed protein product [Candida verbasci]
MKFGEKLQEFIYLLSTNDKYSEFDSRKSFNRVNKPDSENLLNYYQQNDSSIESNNASGNSRNGVDGVHEVKLAWRHIKNWLIKYNPDLNHSLQSKCTDSDLQDFQKDLNIKLPNCVYEFFKLTDGQSNFGNNLQIETCGLFFGLKLMSLDEIMISTENWRKVAKTLNKEIRQQNLSKLDLSILPTSHSNSNQYKKKLSGDNSEIETSSEPQSFDLSRDNSNASSIYDLSSQPKFFNIPKQRSIPPGAIHETFAHPMWIPIVTDEVGNYIGIDLSPGPLGSYGQIILFGREFDFKFKISDNWGDFLLIFANDLEIGNWELKYNKKNADGDLFIGNEGDLVFIDKISKLEFPYLEILKRRSLKKWIDTIDDNKENEEHDSNKSRLLEELKKNQISILSLKNNNRSVDDFINKNLTLLNIEDNKNGNISTIKEDKETEEGV